jgi:hypothetical protein
MFILEERGATGGIARQWHCAGMHGKRIYSRGSIIYSFHPIFQQKLIIVFNLNVNFPAWLYLLSPKRTLQST